MKSDRSKIHGKGYYRGIRGIIKQSSERKEMTLGIDSKKQSTSRYIRNWNYF